MLLRFTKMHGCGNDFVLLDLISQNLQITGEQIRHLADRRFGIGFDQLLTVEPPEDPEADFRYRIYNADGTEAEQCGNGARCLTRFVRDRGLTTKTGIRLQTRTGHLDCKLQKDGNITVNMGAPRLVPNQVPFIADEPRITYQLPIRQSDICKSIQTIDVAVVSMGNPHAVIKVDRVEEAPVSRVGSLLQNHEQFPDRVNVGFMQVIDSKNICLRVFERGVGETQACGSGACAAVVAGRLQGLLDDEVSVKLEGGTLNVAWEGDNSPVFLTGPACRVYEGHLHI